MAEIIGTLQGIAAIQGTLSGQGALNGSLGIPTVISSETYTGPYVYTPTQYTQTIDISRKTATQNITINPIPTDYGKITWDGAVLTVS